MNVGELLEELRVNILRDISDRIESENDDNLWSDIALVRYINEGERRFARRTECLRDKTTPAVTQIVLVQGQSEYTLDSRVFNVLSATYDGIDIRRTQHDALAGSPGAIAGGSTDYRSTWAARPYLFSTDEAVKTLRVFPIPNEEADGHVLQLRVARLPLNPLVASDINGVPEIDEDHHLDILEWAAYRALRNHDVDAENMNKASAHKTRFEQAVQELGAESKRQMSAPYQFGVDARFY